MKKSIYFWTAFAVFGIGLGVTLLNEYVRLVNVILHLTTIQASFFVTLAVVGAGMIFTSWTFDGGKDR